jgi:hypothetical protein
LCWAVSVVMPPFCGDADAESITHVHFLFNRSSAFELCTACSINRALRFMYCLFYKSGIFAACFQSRHRKGRQDPK